jgi:arylsulfatase A-like enzyme
MKSNGKQQLKQQFPGFRQAARWARLALLAAVIPGALAHPAAAATPRPNIVVILSDDMGYADVPGFGADKEIPMPAIDRLAGEGVRFTDAYVSAPICVPSRMGLMTGRHQARDGVYTNVYGGSAYSAFQGERLMPAYFKEAGYATGIFGKWHLSGNGDISKRSAPELPDAKGWDEIDADIGEKRNLAGEQPEKVKELHARLLAWRNETNAQLPKANPDYTPGIQRKGQDVLKALDADTLKRLKDYP